MNTAITYFTLFLITLPDIETDKHQIHRLVFHDYETCMYIASALNQKSDPWVGKRNCVEVEDYRVEIKIPLPKPEGMS